MKVSIIVPVLNSEKHLRTCIDSLLNQSYQNIEIILIDNGSTDSSVSICKEYSIKYENIKFDYQERKGPSAARNKGIDLSTGDYLQFVDSDDYIENDMVEKLVNALIKGKSSLAICGLKKLVITHKSINTIYQNPPFFGDFKINEFNKNFGQLFKEVLINSPCNKIYQKKLIDDYQIRFKENVNMGEDLLFNLEYLKFCTRISIINECLYNYTNYKNSNSLTKSFKENLFENQKMLFEKIREYLNECASYENNKDIIENIYTNNILGCFCNLFHRQSTLDSSSIKKEINKIVSDETVTNNIVYFLKGNLPKRLIGYFIKRKNINLIYYSFLIIKNILK